MIKSDKYTDAYTMKTVLMSVKTTPPHFLIIISHLPSNTQYDEDTCTKEENADEMLLTADMKTSSDSILQIQRIMKNCTET